MDLARYRTVFIEEATEHLEEMSRALLELEKDTAATEAIDLVFRMAHSIKGMAASLEYDTITQVSHALEDRMDEIREAGRVSGPGELALLFRGLEGLEKMVASVRDGETPPAEPELTEALKQGVPAESADSDAKKKPRATPEARAPEPPAPRGAAPEAPTPPPSVRVNTETLDRFLGTVGEVILSSSQLRTAATTTGTSQTGLSVGLDRMDRVVGDLQRRALELRTTPLLRIVEPLPRTAREIAQRLDKRVEVEIRNAEIELDRSILDRLSDPLVHILRNAVDHGIEAPAERAAAGKPEVGRISIDARREKDSIIIEISDDGRGIDLETVRARAVEAGLVLADLAEDLPADQVAAFVFHPGLSTKSAVSEISGRGVGMDAVRATIESLGGHIELHTEAGRGTRTVLVVPITAAIQRVLLLQVADESVAIPVSRVERILEVPAGSIEQSGREAFVLVDDEPVPVLDLAAQLALRPEAGEETLDAEAGSLLVLADVHGEPMALRVDAIGGHQQIYVKPVPELLLPLRALAGLTILGDGCPVFLLDLNQL